MEKPKAPTGLEVEGPKDTDPTEYTAENTAENTFTPEEIERFERYVIEDERTPNEADYLNNLVQVLKDLSEFLVDNKTNRLIFTAKIATEIAEDDFRELRIFLDKVAKMQDLK